MSVDWLVVVGMVLLAGSGGWKGWVERFLELLLVQSHLILERKKNRDELRGLICSMVVRHLLNAELLRVFLVCVCGRGGRGRVFRLKYVEKWLERLKKSRGRFNSGSESNGTSKVSTY